MAVAAVTVDFGAMLDAHRRGEEYRPPRRERVRGKWPKRGVTFDVERGSFTVSAAILQRADATGDDHEIRIAFARGMAGHDDARPYRYERRKDGLHVYWRSIRVVKAQS